MTFADFDRNYIAGGLVVPTKTTSASGEPALEYRPRCSCVGVRDLATDEVDVLRGPHCELAVHAL